MRIKLDKIGVDWILFLNNNPITKYQYHNDAIKDYDHLKKLFGIV